MEERSDSRWTTSNSGPEATRAAALTDGYTLFSWYYRTDTGMRKAWVDPFKLSSEQGACRQIIAPASPIAHTDLYHFVPKSGPSHRLSPASDAFSTGYQVFV